MKFFNVDLKSMTRGQSVSSVNRHSDSMSGNQESPLAVITSKFLVAIPGMYFKLFGFKIWKFKLKYGRGLANSILMKSLVRTQMVLWKSRELRLFNWPRLRSSPLKIKRTWQTQLWTWLIWRWLVNPLTLVRSSLSKLINQINEEILFKRKTSSQMV